MDNAYEVGLLRDKVSHLEAAVLILAKIAIRDGRWTTTEAGELLSVLPELRTKVAS